MTDWNKGLLVLLAGACVAVFGSVYFLAARGPEPVAHEHQPPEAPRPPERALAAAMPAVTAVHAENADAGHVAPVQRAEPDPADEAIRRIAENPTPDDVAYLSDVAQREGDARLRLMAIEGLQRAAISGGDDGTVARSLRRMASSRDPQVSHAARRAISQIGQHRTASTEDALPN